MLDILKKSQHSERIGYTLVVLFFILVASVYEHPIKDISDPLVTIETVDEIKEVKPKNLNRFLDDIAFKESSNRYNVQNQYGYMGKYQFGQATLKGLGYDVTRKQFINDPELQEEAMIDLLLHNREYLEDYIRRWDGKTKAGIVITESGILAAAHLGGQRNVRNFFRYDRDFKDGNGTKLSYYLKKFGGYDLGFEDMKNDYIAEIPRKRVIEHEKRLLTR